MTSHAWRQGLVLYKKVVAELPVSTSQTILEVSTGMAAIIFRMVETKESNE